MTSREYMPLDLDTITMTSRNGERPVHTNNESDVNRTRTGIAATLAALLVLAASAATAKKDAAKHLSWEDGLSQTTVFAIHHDRNGAVWFGTEDGLNRFDGESFTVFRHDPRNPDSLPANTIRDLAEGADGRIWVATEGGGVAAWDPLTKAFVHYRRQPLAERTGLGSNYTRAVLFDDAGYVWIASRDTGLDRLDPTTGLVTNFRHDASDPSSLADDRVYALLQARDGRIYVGTNRGLDRFDGTTGSFEHLDLQDAAPSTRVRALFADRQGVLWVGTRGSGLFGYDLVTESIRQYKGDDDDRDSDVDSDRRMTDSNVQTILEDDYGQLWIGTANGLNQFDRETGLFAKYGAIDISATGGSGSVTSLHVDGKGALWVGTELGGLIRWEGPKGHFRDHGAKSNDIVTSFTQDRKGNLFIGTVGKGLARVDKRGRLMYLKHESDDPTSLSDDRVMSLFTDSKGRVWVGTMQGGLNKLDPKRLLFTSYRHDPAKPTSLSADGVMTVREDFAGNLWVGTFGGGLNKFDPRTKTFTAFRHDPENPATLGSDRVTSILATESGMLWVGTDGGGLNLFDPATGTARRFQHDPLDPTSLPADTVCSLFTDRFGTLWIGTRGGGLAKMIGEPSELLEPTFFNYGEADGLPNSVVYAIQPDADGALWLSTNHGLSRFDPSALSFTNFDASDGLQANEFNFGASYRSAKGDLYFGGINGYNTLAPATVDAAADDDPRETRRAQRRSRRGDRGRRAAATATSTALTAGF